MNNFNLELQSRLRATEQLFEDPGLKSLRRTAARHPVIARFDILTKYLASGRLPQLGEETDILFAIDAAMKERFVFPTGDVREMADAAKIVQIQKRLVLPDDFDDLMSELFFCRWLRNREFDAELREDEGAPDVQIRGIGWAEVKHLREGTKPANVAAKILDAGRKFRRVDSPGVVYLDVDRIFRGAALDDQLPDDVVHYIRAASDSLGGPKNRLVSRIVVGWQDYMVLSDGGDASWVFRRRSYLLRHRDPEPGRSLAIDDQHLAVGIWSAFFLRAEGTPTVDAYLPPKRINDVVVEPSFRIQQKFANGIRAENAVGVFQQADGSSAIITSAGSLVLKTKVMNVGSRPFVVLIVAWTDNGITRIIDGYKLFPAIGEDLFSFVDPNVAFDTVLSRYGCMLIAGTSRGRLVQQECIVGCADADVRILDVLQANGGIAATMWFRSIVGSRTMQWTAFHGAPGFNAVTQVRPECLEPPIITIAIAYATRTDAYRRDVAVRGHRQDDPTEP